MFVNDSLPCKMLIFFRAILIDNLKRGDQKLHNPTYSY